MVNQASSSKLFLFLQFLVLAGVAYWTWQTWRHGSLDLIAPFVLALYFPIFVLLQILLIPAIFVVTRLEARGPRFWKRLTSVAITAVTIILIEMAK